MRWRRWILITLGSFLALGAILMAAWSIAIGPAAVWRVLTHGTTTVWDHLEYPGRDLEASDSPRPWTVDEGAVPVVLVDGRELRLPEVLAERNALAFLVIRDGVIEYSWAAPGHSVSTPSMLFSITKSVTSLMIGAAIEDGLIGSVGDAVTVYLPELSTRGFEDVTIEDALQMDTGSMYVEGDNPFGIHVEFNYTDRLESRILGLAADAERRGEFTYKSGDNALLGLILHRAVEPESISEYLQRRLLNPLGVEDGGVWSTDHDGGLERTWCCLALSARDLARLGQLIVDGGVSGGARVISQGWLDSSFATHYGPERWPSEYAETLLADYGYQWWLLNDGSVLALGKDGQYLYVDTARRLVLVRTGTSQGGIGWLDVLRQIAEAYPVID